MEINCNDLIKFEKVTVKKYLNFFKNICKKIENLTTFLEMPTTCSKQENSREIIQLIIFSSISALNRISLIITIVYKLICVSDDFSFKAWNKRDWINDACISVNAKNSFIHSILSLISLIKMKLVTHEREVMICKLTNW